MDYSARNVCFFVPAPVKVGKGLLKAAAHEPAEPVEVLGMAAGHPGVYPGVEYAVSRYLVYLDDKFYVAVINFHVVALRYIMRTLVEQGAEAPVKVVHDMVPAAGVVEMLDEPAVFEHSDEYAVEHLVPGLDPVVGRRNLRRPAVNLPLDELVDVVKVVIEGLPVEPALVCYVRHCYAVQRLPLEQGAQRVGELLFGVFGHETFPFRCDYVMIQKSLLHIN